MVVARVRVIGASWAAPWAAPFWLSAFCAALMPSSVGYQDLAALIARQPGVVHSWPEHLIASPFGTIEAATISYVRPLGTAMPRPPNFRAINYDPSEPGANSWRIDRPITQVTRQAEYPTVDRTHKGDRLPVTVPDNAAESRPQLEPIDAAPPAGEPVEPTVQPVPPVAPILPRRPKDAELEDATPTALEMEAVNDASTARAPAGSVSADTVTIVQARSGASAEHDTVSALAADSDHDAIAQSTGKGGPSPAAARAESIATDASPQSFAAAFLDGDAQARSAQIYFGGVLGTPSALQQWAPGAEPILVSPAVAGLGGSGEEPAFGPEAGPGRDDVARLGTPAQRLGLEGEPRAKAEKCLADAVYFEARGEPLRGQEAVAQVVMNRVFSGYYPHDVCGVVYQNANRHLACQFTFACEGKDLSRIDEPDMWEQAKSIARESLDGKIWLADIGHATHYHAYWVHPSWVHEMTRLYRLGVHTFYRPRNWGNGDDEPAFGGAPNTSKADGDGTAAKTSDAGPVPAKPDPGKEQRTAKL